jgi:predicted ATPase
MPSRRTAVATASGSPHLRSIALKRAIGGEETAFPFSVAAVRTLPTLAFPTAVTFFVGENGSGKSTLLEALAIAAALPTVGAEHVARDTSLDSQRALANRLRLTWNGKRSGRGFFLRAEDFFGYTKSLAALRQEMLQRVAEVERDYADRSAYARGLAAGPARASLGDMERRYGIDLDANSHGQSFLKLFRNRFVPGGVYLLDEPEAPLSPQSQLGLIAMLMQMVADDAQFIIATHSPILLAFPGATIYSFDAPPVRAVPFDELEHVTLTREFLRDPQRFLRLL